MYSIDHEQLSGVYTSGVQEVRSSRVLCNSNSTMVILHSFVCKYANMEGFAVTVTYYVVGFLLAIYFLT